jgi:hypothetical protein
MQRIGRIACVAALVTVLLLWTLYAAAMALPMVLLFLAVASSGVVAALLALVLAVLFYGGSVATAIAVFTTVSRQHRGARWPQLLRRALLPLAAAIIGAIGVEAALGNTGPFIVPVLADLAWH